METRPPVKKPVYLNTSSTAMWYPAARARTRRRREALSSRYSRCTAQMETSVPAHSTAKASRPPPAM